MSMLLAPSFPPAHGGIETFMYGVFSRLSDATTIVTFDVSGAAAFDQSPPLSITRIARRGNAVSRIPESLLARVHYSLFCCFRMVAPVRAMIVRRGCRILFVSHINAGLAALIIRKTLKIPYVLFIHGNEILKSGSWLVRMTESLIIPRILNGADAIIANSRNTAGLVAAWTRKPLRIEIVPLGPGMIDIRSVAAGGHSAGRDVVLLSVSRLVHRKGHAAVLRAFAALSGEYPALRYCIAGDGPERSRLESLACELGVQSLVDFRGDVDDAALEAMYRSSDIFVLPVYEDPNRREIEGFGIVFLEAAVFGLPVIAGRSGGVADAVVDGKTGILVTPQNHDELVAALRRLIGDPALRASLGQAGRERVQREMNWDRSAEAVARLAAQIAA
jgi:phosphatidylinositol alpha-1,6-mannosyltransferase